MKLKLTIITTIIIICITALVMQNKTTTNNEAESNKKTNVVFFGPEAYKNNFINPNATKGDFYEVFGKGTENLIAGNYPEAIKWFKESEQHSGIGIETAMVYNQLIETYRDMGDLEGELKYLELIPKYALGDHNNARWNKRIQDIKDILAGKKEKDDSNRYPMPPAYGRPFKSHREVVIAQRSSRKLSEMAGLLYRDGKHQEAIDVLNKAYVPYEQDNAYIEYQLIQCYLKLNEFTKAQTLIEYTLRERKWGKENIDELKKWQQMIQHMGDV